jgi:hypothetical protein
MFRVFFADQLPPYSCSTLRWSVIAEWGLRCEYLSRGAFFWRLSSRQFKVFLKTEPLGRDPYAVVFVNDGSCSVVKILKVTGSIRGQSRKRSCVLFEEERASLSRS